MAYSQMLRELFPEITLHAEDILLLEAFQVKYLLERADTKEFACLLGEYPFVHRFLIGKYPPIDSFLKGLLEKHPQTTEREEVDEQCQEALWEIADMIIYNKHPDLYDCNTRIQWDIDEISSITSMDGKTVADVGAGSGRIAFLLAPFASTVFAVEPIASFRSFMKEKVVKQELKNLFIMDGTLDSLPLPDNMLDVLITSNAIGWNIMEELREIERVVRPGGCAIHLLHSDTYQENPFHEKLTSSPWNYKCIRDDAGETKKIRYFKEMQASVAEMEIDPLDLY